MAEDIKSFLSNFQGGGARPNRYDVIFTFPGSIPGSVGAAQKIAYTCSAASIPSSNIGVVDLPFKGRQVKVAGDKVFDDWTVTIMIDSDFLGRTLFERWHDQIMGFSTNVAQTQMINPINQYATAIVHALDRAGRITQRYTIEGMFPSQLGEITLGWDQNDQVMLQQVTFAINGWKSLATS